MNKRVFNDSSGRRYTHLEADGMKKGIFCIDGVNKELEGIFKIVKRDGNSVFGEEVIIELLIKKLVKEYSTTSKHNVMEIYLKKEEAVELLENMLKELNKKEQKGSHNQEIVERFKKEKGVENNIK